MVAHQLLAPGARTFYASAVTTFSGVDMASGAGLLYAARVFSAAQLVLDAEVWDLLCSTSEGSARGTPSRSPST